MPPILPTVGLQAALPSIALASHLAFQHHLEGQPLFEIKPARGAKMKKKVRNAPILATEPRLADPLPGGQGCPKWTCVLAAPPSTCGPGGEAVGTAYRELRPEIRWISPEIGQNSTLLKSQGATGHLRACPSTNTLPYPPPT